jgi:hypothetical protein
LSCVVFLDLNGHCSALSQREATRLVIDAITAGMDVAAIAERLRVREVGSPAK